MNQNPGPVKPSIRIQVRERGSMGSMDAGRSADSAVGWYCHMRLKKLLDEGMKQNAIAERTGLQPAGKLTKRS